MDSPSGSETETLSLDQAATHLLNECRMVLPGIQALFGFQLVAVFNSRFGDTLSSGEQRLHLVAILCMAVAIALVMSPAALHRQTNPRQVSEKFLEISSRLLMGSMVPLAIGTALDLYVVARVIVGPGAVAATCALAVLVVIALLWVVMPRVVRLER